MNYKDVELLNENEAHEFMSDLFVQCGKAAGVDSECWTRANGEVFRTYSGDVINARIVQIARSEKAVKEKGEREQFERPKA